MKVRVSMPGAYMTVEMDEEAAQKTFRKMVEVLCSANKGKITPEKEEYLPEPVKVVAPAYVEPVQKYLEQDDIEDVEDENSDVMEQNPKYKGFMFIKCPECGKVKGFFMKKESDHYHCDNCGARTEFKDPLVTLFVNCECGEKFKYLTNMDDFMFDINCLGCGAPVPVKWNDKKKIYETIRER